MIREHEYFLWRKAAIWAELSESEKRIFAWAVEGVGEDELVTVDARITRGERDVIAVRRPTEHDLLTLTEI